MGATGCTTGTLGVSPTLEWGGAPDTHSGYKNITTLQFLQEEESGVKKKKICVLVWLMKDGTLDSSSSIGGGDNGEGAGR